MNVTQTLIEDHRLIIEYVGLMRKYILLDHDNENSLLLNRVGAFIDFIRIFADEYHHVREEDILFKYLGQPGVLVQCDPIEEMLKDHKDARAALKGMVAGQRLQDAAMVAEHMERYTNILLNHIYKEDHIVFPMAETELSLVDKGAILQEYGDMEARRNGERIRTFYQVQKDNLETEIQMHRFGGARVN